MPGSWQAPPRAPIDLGEPDALHKVPGVVILGLLLRPRRVLAGPVTTDAIGDMVQTVPKGELPQFAGPARRTSGASIGTPWIMATSSSTSHAHAVAPASATRTTAPVTSSRSTRMARLPSPATPQPERWDGHHA